MRKKIHLKISGMTCTNCRDRIANKLNKTNGIIKATVSYEKNSAEISYDDNKISFEQIKATINKLGYEISDGKTDFVRSLIILMSIILIYKILQSSGLLNFLVPGQLADSKMSYGMLFLIGLTTSLHCVATCGGINLSQSISNLKSFYPVIAYNFGRVLSYTIIGSLLGAIGFFMNGAEKFELSIFFQSALKITAGFLWPLWEQRC